MFLVLVWDFSVPVMFSGILHWGVFNSFYNYAVTRNCSGEQFLDPIRYFLSLGDNLICVWYVFLTGDSYNFMNLYYLFDLSGILAEFGICKSMDPWLSYKLFNSDIFFETLS